MAVWAALDRRVVASRFWPKVEIRGPDECWPWLGAVKRRRRGDSRPEYGVLKVTVDGVKRDLPAHCVVLWLHEDLDPVLQGNHACDFSLCCNPIHVRQGTHLENMEEMSTRGRAASGRRNGNYVHGRRSRLGRRNGR